MFHINPSYLMGMAGLCYKIKMIQHQCRSCAPPHTHEDGAARSIERWIWVNSLLHWLHLTPVTSALDHAGPILLQAPVFFQPGSPNFSPVLALMTWSWCRSRGFVAQSHHPETPKPIIWGFLGKFHYMGVLD